jgi:hypothetical protein
LFVCLFVCLFVFGFGFGLFNVGVFFVFNLWPIFQVSLYWPLMITAFGILDLCLFTCVSLRINWRFSVHIDWACLFFCVDIGCFIVNATYNTYGGHLGRDRIVVGFTTTYAISASIQHYVIKFVSDFRQSVVFSGLLHQ